MENIAIFTKFVDAINALEHQSWIRLHNHDNNPKFYFNLCIHTGLQTITIRQKIHDFSIDIADDRGGHTFKIIENEKGKFNILCNDKYLKSNDFNI